MTARLVTLNPGAEIVERDLAVDPPPHSDLDFYEAILSPVPDDDPRFSLSEQMIRELDVADFVLQRGTQIAIGRCAWYYYRC